MEHFFLVNSEHAGSLGVGDSFKTDPCTDFDSGEHEWILIGSLVFSVLACLGLVENSSVILVASMLVSPLMVSPAFTNPPLTIDHLHIIYRCIHDLKIASGI